jgi:hypothetical protein
VPNFTRLDPSRPKIAILVDAMLRAREVVAVRPWSTSQEPTSEHWWADVLADPRARIRRQPRGLSGRDGRRMAQKAYHRLADEPNPVIEVACSKCEWKAAFSRADLITDYGAECPLPNLLDHLAAGVLKNQKPVGSVRRLLCQSNRSTEVLPGDRKFLDYAFPPLGHHTGRVGGQCTLLLGEHARLLG